MEWTLTLQFWFFASEVSCYSLQLAQLAMSWVNICLTVCPTHTQAHEQKRADVFWNEKLQPTEWNSQSVCFTSATHHSSAMVRSGASKSWRPEEKQDMNMEEYKKADTLQIKKDLPSSIETFPMKIYCPYPLVKTMPRLSNTEKRTTRVTGCMKHTQSL